MQIGYKLKNLRRQKNLTQEELAERTDLSKGYISQIESEYASPSMETFLSILEVLGTRPSDFFKEKAKEKVLYKKSEMSWNKIKALLSLSILENCEDILITLYICL